MSSPSMDWPGVDSRLTFPTSSSNSRARVVLMGERVCSSLEQPNGLSRHCGQYPGPHETSRGSCRKLRRVYATSNQGRMEWKLDCTSGPMISLSSCSSASSATLYCRMKTSTLSAKGVKSLCTAAATAKSWSRVGSWFRHIIPNSATARAFLSVERSSRESRSVPDSNRTSHRRKSRGSSRRTQSLVASAVKVGVQTSTINATQGGTG